MSTQGEAGDQAIDRLQGDVKSRTPQIVPPYYDNVRAFIWMRGLSCLDLFERAQNLGIQRVVVVIDDVLDLPCPVYYDAFQMLHQILTQLTARR